MQEAIVKQFENLAQRITEIEQHDPKLKELKEHVRAATEWVRRADTDEIPEAIRAENTAIAALIQHIYG